MEPGIYVGLTGQMALQRRLDTIANNVANAGTTGFRAENVTFESVLSRQAIAYANAAQTTFAQRTGPLVQTGNPLDVAIEGNAYLSIATPAGTALTRDGRMRIAANGELQTIEGFAVLDQGGAPLQLNPTLGSLEIGRAGTVSQGGNQVGTLGLYRVPQDAQLTRGPGVGLIADKAPVAVTDFTTTGLVQGHVEGSNVNAVHEMTRLIAVQRAFEAVSASLDQSDRKLSDAIRALGDGRR